MTASRLDREAVVARLTETDVQEVFRRLGVQSFKSGGTGNYLVSSPLREGDEHPSFSIKRVDGLWNDKATGEGGSIFDAVMQKLGVGFPEAIEFVADVAGIQSEHTPATPAPRRIDHTYCYADEHGDTLYETVRYDPKDFRQRHPDGKGGWEWNLNGTRRVPYRLDKLMEADATRTRVIFEGEKDADLGASLGLVSTTFVGGSKAWRSEYAAYFVDVPVVIVPHNDHPGASYGQSIAADLHGIAISVKILNLPGLGPRRENHGLDFTDWVEQGGTRAEFVRLALAVPEWQPPAEPAIDDAIGPRLSIKPMSEIDVQPIDWLWKLWLARGKVAILAGVEGDGKSYVSAALVATLSVGGVLPDGTTAPRCRVLLLIAEDGIEDTVKPRLERHGADMDAVFVVEAVRETGKHDAMFSLGRHIPLLRESIVTHRIDVVVIDPLSSFLQSSNRNDEGEVRDFLTPLLQMANETGTAILGIAHLNRPNGVMKRATQRILGSTAFAAVARLVWMLAPAGEEDDPTRRVLAVVKSNIGMKPPAIEWSLPSEDSPVVWQGESQRDIDELLSGGSRKRERTPERERILAHLEDAPSALTPTEVATALDMSVGSVKNILRKMLDEGDVTQPNYGRYSAVTLNGDVSDDSDDSSDLNTRQQSLESLKTSVITVTCPHCNSDDVFPNAGGRLLCRTCWKFVESERVA